MNESTTPPNAPNGHSLASTNCSERPDPTIRAPYYPWVTTNGLPLDKAAAAENTNHSYDNYGRHERG